MKKILALVLAMAMVFALCACGSSSAPAASAPAAAESNTSSAPEAAPEAAEAAPEAKTIKFGLITLHDENSTYDANFINSAKEAKEILEAQGIGFDLVIKTGIDEGEICFETACDLADEGCDLILADSFGHEPFIIKAAKEYPNVQFLHATGTQAHVVERDNFHDGFASIYEGRYLAGVAAGMKLAEMLENGEATEAKVGYVGAFTYAEVVSGYTAWFLGVKSIVPEVTMEVTFTGSWYDVTLENEGANTLIQNGCVLLSQHADSMGAPTACETAGVPDVTYNVPTGEACPNTYLIYSKINWAPYIVYATNCILNGEDIGYDFVGTVDNGAVVIGDPSAIAVEGTAEKLAEVAAKLASGELHVFDCSTFTVGGETLTEYMADIDGDFVGDTNVIHDGYFDESGADFRSAPYFDLQIDGITLLNQNYG